MRRHPSLLLLPFLAACLSQNAPPPAVRWFDPSQAPVGAAPDAGQVGAVVRPLVTAAPFLRQEFVVRTGPRELAIDDQHRWIAAPDRLVAAALDRALLAPRPSAEAAGSEPFTVHVVRFEFELEPAVRAVVELQVRRRSGATAVVRGEAPSRSREPADLAEAMAEALAAAAQRVAASP